jgi:hypothetical protein
MTLSLSHRLVWTAANDDFNPFNTMGMIVYFKTCVPMDLETHNLPIIMLKGEDWDPVNVGLGNGQSRIKWKCKQFGLWKLECQNGRWQQ